MTDLKNMSVDELIEDFNRFVSVHEPEYAHIKEMARRLREQEQRWKTCDDLLRIEVEQGHFSFEHAEQTASALLACQGECAELRTLLVKAHKYMGLVRSNDIAGDDPIFAVMDEIGAILSRSTGSKIMKEKE